MNTTEAIRVRRATRSDAAGLIRLIVALAEFEKLTPPDAAAQERLLADGFGSHPRFEAWIAFWGDAAEPVGYAILFETYSTFKASPSLYLEDIFVLPDFRGQGIGSALIRTGVQIAYDRGCARMEWTCLDWNTRAQEGYERLGARRLSEWVLYRLDREHIERVARGDAQLPGRAVRK
jgi:GNAT superfamily N-acetyltransferase